MDSSWLFNLGANVYAWFTAQSAWRSSCAALAAELKSARCPGEGQGERWFDLESAVVVDLGCGPGVSTFALARALQNTTLIGVDVAPRMLAEARRRTPGSLLGRVRWVLASAARLPFRDGSVDACTGHSFLYLVDNRRAVLAEARRVLRPGGRLVLMEPNAAPVTVQQALAISRDPRHLISVSLWRPFSRVHGRFSVRTLVETVERAGFVEARARVTLGGLGVLATAHAPDPGDRVERIP